MPPSDLVQFSNTSEKFVNGLGKRARSLFSKHHLQIKMLRGAEISGMGKPARQNLDAANVQEGLATRGQSEPKASNTTARMNDRFPKESKI